MECDGSTSLLNERSETEERTAVRQAWGGCLKAPRTCGAHSKAGIASNHTAEIGLTSRPLSAMVFGFILPGVSSSRGRGEDS